LGLFFTPENRFSRFAIDVQSRDLLGGGEFATEVIVPVGSTATVYVPAQDPEQVSEGGVVAEIYAAETLI
jgi:hypothetical protein